MVARRKTQALKEPRLRAVTQRADAAQRTGTKNPRAVEKAAATPRPKRRIPRALRKPKHVLVPKTDLSGQPQTDLSGEPLVGRRLDRFLNTQIEEKANPLMQHYGIPLLSPDRWRHLSWCLLEELKLITFAPPKERHRSRVWRHASAQLVQRMDEILVKGKLTVSAAAGVLIGRYPEYEHLKRKSLVNRYKEAKQARRLPGLYFNSRLTFGTELLDCKTKRSVRSNLPKK